VFDMYGDSRENLLDSLAVVVVLSLVSSVCGSRPEIYWDCEGAYGVASINRPLKIIGLFCRIVSFVGLFCKRDLSFCRRAL